MQRIALAVALGLFANGPFAAHDAYAFVFGTKATQAARTASANTTIGLRADQLKVGTKRWFEQMEREGRFGQTR